MDRENLRMKKKAAYISLSVGFGMFAFKLFAYFITGSSAIFSDAAESVVHVMATSVALYSIFLSAKPADKNHLYGHGNVEYFSAGLEGLLINIAAIVIIYKAVHDIIFGFDPKSLNTGTIIIFAAGLINGFLGFYLIRQGKKTRSLTLIADGKHVLTDSFTSVGVVLGLIIVILSGYVIVDALMAIFVAINILFTGTKLIRESVGGLMNETDDQTLSRLVNLLIRERKDYWIDLHHFRFWASSDKVFVDFHLTMPYYLTIRETHTEEELILKKIREEISTAELRVHIDYCTYDLCKFCNYQNCDDRKFAFESKPEWDSEKLIGEPINPDSHIS